MKLHKATWVIMPLIIAGFGLRIGCISPKHVAVTTQQSAFKEAARAVTAAAVKSSTLHATRPDKKYFAVGGITPDGTDLIFELYPNGTASVTAVKEAVLCVGKFDLSHNNRSQISCSTTIANRDSVSNPEESSTGKLVETTIEAYQARIAAMNKLIPN